MKPLGFIAAAIADGVTETQVLLPDGASEHDYSLRPSDVKRLQNADLVVWIGPEMEAFMDKSTQSIAANKKVTIAELDGVKPLLITGADDDDDHHGHDHGAAEKGDGDHHHGIYNMHLWLSPEIARLSAVAIHDKLLDQPDGHFPNGIPNPLLPECRQDTADAVRAHQADMGIAFDGDFDRCFLFDDEASFIEGYYIVGLLAEAFLQKQPGAKIIHDPRLTWNTVDIVTRSGGQPVMSKTGHAFIKERMRQEDAIYGGEMSAHHYFRDFAYCDSGMIPWLLVAELLCLKNSSLKSLVADRQAAFPASGEINRKLGNAAEAIARIRAQYEPAAAHIDTTDGISIEYPEWRFNLRTSNTEPVVRLNVESRADTALMNAKTEEILALLK